MASSAKAVYVSTHVHVSSTGGIVVAFLGCIQEGLGGVTHSYTEDNLK